MKMTQKSLEKSVMHLHMLYKSNVSGARFATSIIPTFPIGILDILKFGNRVQKQHEYPMKMKQKSLEKSVRHLHRLYKSGVFGARFATSIILTLPIGILDMLKFGNRIQKQHEYPMKMTQESLEKSFSHLRNVYKSNVFGTRFATSRIPTFLMGILDILKIGNRVRKLHEFPMELERNSLKSQCDTSICFINPTFPERVLRLPEYLLS